VLLGAPVSTRLDRWALARSCVSGRLINGFSSRDWILGLVYRGSNGAVPSGDFLVSSRNCHGTGSEGLIYNGSLK
jgi:hypothetical protein